MAATLKPLDEQTIVITGASSGIGLATARMAARHGARLVLAARNGEALELIAQELRHDTDVEVVVADVGRQEDVRRIADAAVRRFSGFDTWVNNAGISIYGQLTEVTLEDQRQLFETNYWGVVNGSLEAARGLAGRGGAIINVGSILSDRAIPLQGPYCASKHAVDGFTETLRMELEHEQRGISVTLIKPSAMDTPFADHAKNYMENEPILPPPVYSPDVTAEAILYAAENAVRDLTVGGGGWLSKAIGNLVPRLADFGMEATMFQAQQRDLPRDTSRESSLYKAGRGGQQVGPYPGPVRQSSSFLQMQKRPVTSFLIASTIGVLIAGAAIARLGGGRLRLAERD